MDEFVCLCYISVSNNHWFLCINFFPIFSKFQYWDVKFPKLSPYQEILLKIRVFFTEPKFSKKIGTKQVYNSWDRESIKMQWIKKKKILDNPLPNHQKIWWQCCFTSHLITSHIKRSEADADESPQWFPMNAVGYVGNIFLLD